MKFQTIKPGRDWLASRVCQTLVRRGVDFASLSWLAKVVGASEPALRSAVDNARCLGLLRLRPEPVVYCLPPQPLGAGFELQLRNGRLMLRLPSHGLRPALLISGQHVGPMPAAERVSALGAGELAYAIARLTQMAGDWLPDVADPTRYLSELIAEGWRHASASRDGGGPLSIYRAEFREPIAPGTNRLELVTNRQRGSHQLVNVYPIPTRRVMA